MGRILRLSRFFVAAGALTASVGYLTACSRHEGPEVYAYECERRAVPTPSTPTSLTDALTQQAAVNKAYRECIDRRGVRAAH